MGFRAPITRVEQRIAAGLRSDRRHHERGAADAAERDQRAGRRRVEPSAVRASVRRSRARPAPVDQPEGDDGLSGQPDGSVDRHDVDRRDLRRQRLARRNLWRGLRHGYRGQRPGADRNRGARGDVFRLHARSFQRRERRARRRVAACVRLR